MAAAVLITDWALDIPLRSGLLLGLVCIIVATNVVLARRPAGSESSSALLGGVVGLDVATLTALLLLSGGASNPFSALYFVYVTLAAVLLGGRWAWGILVLSVLCFGALFLWSVPVPALSMHGGGGGHGGHSAHGGGSGTGARAHLYGMFVAFAVAASLIAYFVSRLSKALRWQEKELHSARERALQSERLASLTTLAAGAAHELGTPLGTIAVVAGELTYQLREGGLRAELAEDADLIRREVGRCRDILDQMSARAGAGVGEAPERVYLANLLEELSERLGPQGHRLKTEIEEGLSVICMPRRAVEQVLTNLVQNALDASTDDVTLMISKKKGGILLQVLDEGAGMDAATLERATDPFFTTKETGSGMGLGLFLSRTIAEGLHGELKLESTPGRGTVATFFLPSP